MADLAAALHLSKTTLYRHFDTKQALFVECIQRLRDRIYGGRDGEGQEEGIVRAVLNSRIVLENFETYSAMDALLHSVASQGNTPLARMAREKMHQIAADSVPLLQRAVAAKMVKPLDTEAVSYILFGAIMWIGHRMQRDPDFSVDDALSVYWEVMARGILQDGALPK